MLKDSRFFLTFSKKYALSTIIKVSIFFFSHPILETYQDPDFIIPPPPEESDEYESDEETSDEEKVKLNDEEAAKMAEARIIDPGSFIDFSSLEPPPPPPEDDIQAKENTNFEPIYHGDNIRGNFFNIHT